MTMFQQLSASAPPLSAAAERRMFARLRLPGGIFKTTIAHRLADVDAATVALLPATLGRVAAIDVGASSGTTSLELLETLAVSGYSTTMTMTDVSLKARLVALGSGYAVLTDRDGHLLQHIVLGLPLRPWRRRLDYITQFWVVTGIANAWFRRIEARGDIARALPRAREVLLVAPQVAAHPAIFCEEGDVFAPPPREHVSRFDVVRAANLLLPEVFAADRIRQALAGLTARLSGPGALLVLARSPAPGRPGANAATIYRMADDGGLEVATRIGAGSDIEALVGT